MKHWTWTILLGVILAVGTWALMIAVLAVLTSCTPMSDSQRAHLVAACDVDGKIIPLAQSVVANMGVPGATASAIDTLLVHPAVIAACAKLQGTPTVTVTATAGS